MNRRYRLTSSTDFKRVRREGKSYAHPLAVLVACVNDQRITRFGFTAGRTVGNAVIRNRAKRLMRETARGQMPIKPGWDVILIARPALPNAEWKDIQHAISGLLRRAGLLEENHDRSS